MDWRLVRAGYSAKVVKNLLRSFSLSFAAPQDGERSAKFCEKPGFWGAVRASMRRMAISKKEVQHVALLARLGLTDAEVEKFTKELSKILEFVSQLSEADTTDVPETAQVSGLKNILRPDAPRPGITREVFLANAPAARADQLKVRGIFS